MSLYWIPLPAPPPPSSATALSPPPLSSVEAVGALGLSPVFQPPGPKSRPMYIRVPKKKKSGKMAEKRFGVASLSTTPTTPDFFFQTLVVCGPLPWLVWRVSCVLQTTVHRIDRGMSYPSIWVVRAEERCWMWPDGRFFRTHPDPHKPHPRHCVTVTVTVRWQSGCRGAGLGSQSPS